MSTALFGQSARAAIHARSTDFRQRASGRWGTMTAREMVCHDADQLRVALGDLKVHAGPLRLRFGTRGSEGDTGTPQVQMLPTSLGPLAAVAESMDRRSPRDVDDVFSRMA